MKRLVSIPLILLLSFVTSNAQVKNNFDEIYGMVKSAADEALVSFDKYSDVYFMAEFPSDYRVLKNRLVADLAKDYSIKTDNNSGLNFSLENIRINYSEPERDGFLGSFITERRILVEGSYFSNHSNKISDSKTFSITKSDTLEYDEIQSYENEALGFTIGNRPDEPMFSTLVEPAVVIGTAIVSVILFFTVRSN